MDYNSITVLISIATLPVLILLFNIYRKDKVEKEPLWLLLILLGCGAASILPALVLELVGEDYLEMSSIDSAIAYLLIDNFLIIALAEELSKFVFLRLFTWRSRAFNYSFDGIVYASFVGLGFALAENILYVIQYGFATGIGRAITAVPAHCTFGIWMGVFYSLSKEAANKHQPFLRKLYKLLALLIPVLIHGTYDFIATISSNETLVLVFIIFIVAVDTITIILINKKAKKDHEIV